MRGVEPDSDRCDLLQTADHQSHADQQHQRQGDFRSDQKLPAPAPRRRRAPSATGFQAGAKVRTRDGKSRPEPEQDGREPCGPDGKSQNWEVDSDQLRVFDIGRLERRDEAD